MSAVSKPLIASQGRREANKLPHLWLCADETALHTLTAGPSFGIGPLPERNLCQVLVIVSPAFFKSRIISTWTQHLHIIFCYRHARKKAVVDLVHSKGSGSGGRDVRVSLWYDMAKSPLQLACRHGRTSTGWREVWQWDQMSAHGATVAHRVAASLGPAGFCSGHSEAVAVNFWRRLRTWLRYRSEISNTTTVPPWLCCCVWLPTLPFLPLLLLLPIKVPIIFDTENLRDLWCPLWALPWRRRHSFTSTSKAWYKSSLLSATDTSKKWQLFVLATSRPSNSCTCKQHKSMHHET